MTARRPGAAPPRNLRPRHKPTLGPKLTHARRDALMVLMHGYRHRVEVTRSNYTTPAAEVTSARRLRVYWQSADWLVGQGYIDHQRLSDVLSLTPAGVDFAEGVGL